MSRCIEREKLISGLEDTINGYSGVKVKVVRYGTFLVTRYQVTLIDQSHSEQFTDLSTNEAYLMLIGVLFTQRSAPTN